MKTIKMLLVFLGLAALACAQGPAGPNLTVKSGTAAATTLPCSDSVNVGAIYTQIINPPVTSICEQTGSATLGQGAYAWVPVGIFTATSCGSSATCASPTTFSQPLKLVTGTIAMSSGTTVGVSGLPAFSSATSYSCSVSNANGHAYTSGVEITSATAFTIISGTSNSDTWIYSCLGN